MTFPTVDASHAVSAPLAAVLNCCLFLFIMIALCSSAVIKKNVLLMRG